MTLIENIADDDDDYTIYKNLKCRIKNWKFGYDGVTTLEFEFIEDVECSKDVEEKEDN